MDFNTGSNRGSGGSNDPSRPLFGSEEARRTTSSPGGAPGGEFTLSDPLGSFVRTVRDIVTRPVGFFAGIRKSGDFVGPVVFALICVEVTVILSSLISLVLNLATGAQGLVEGVLGFVISLILAPIFVAVALAIYAGILHLLVFLIVKPRSTGFEATLRTVAYSSVVGLISWIPILGTIVGSIYNIFLNVVGIRETHGTTTGKAALVVLIPVAVLFVLALLLGTVVVLLLRSAGLA